MRITGAIVFALFHLLFNKKCSALCSGAYGEQPCVFTPAPPGKIPPCARPGYTYCEHPSDYPMELIEYLVKKWVYDHSTLLRNEQEIEYHALQPGFETKYGYNSFNAPYPNSIQQDSYYPEPIHIPKPSYPGSAFHTSGPRNTYIPPAFPTVNISTGFTGYPDRRQPLPSNQQFNFKYPGKNSVQPQRYPVYHGNVPPQPNVGDQQIPYFNQNDLWNSYFNNEEKYLNYTPYQRSKRAIKMKSNRRKLRSLFLQPSNATHVNYMRRKRQTDITGETLCRTQSTYIMPRAAENTRGNWMYVVNMPQMSEMYTQLVKSETCATTQCSGICSLPNGYTSRCEQKYVQKRLVALRESGNQLYTDVFWFPSCCLCTITPN